MAKTDPRPSSNALLWFLLLVSLGLNTYWFLTPKNNSQQVLALVGSKSFRRQNLSQNARTRLSSLDDVTTLVLKKDVDTWLENTILPKEAQSRGKTVQALLDEEVSQKAQVSRQEVEWRLAHSPRADALPYPQVLTDIENDLRNNRAEFAKKNFLESLYVKYQVQIKLRSLGVSAAPEAVPARFPVYTPPANGDPSKGPVDAPVLIEIYSDFMCPFSARFFQTMKEVENQYAGKIRTIYHQFPLPFHQGSHLLSEASLCAQEQGKFWEFHDRLMGQAQGKKEKPELVQVAGELGLDASKFQICMDSGRTVARVDQNIELGKSVGVKGTPGYLINGRSGSGAVPVEALKPLIDWCLKPQGSYPGKQNPAPSGAGAPAAAAPSNALDPGKVYTLPGEWLKKGPSQGPENAPVTIVEFLDYNCPFCQRGNATMEEISAKHPGQIRLISKHFPLSMHPNAMKTAIAASCAAEQGKFWEYRKELFGDSWGKQSAEDLKAAAKKVGLDEKNFGACLDQEKTKDRVNEDMKIAASLGVQGTPTFFINGSPVVGAQPVENFKKLIQAKIAPGKDPRS